ncbi:MAG: hypothetical protein U2P59_01025 [Synergistota bacterium]|nr:hypothetical protein [Synergistota bacterium]
MKHKNNILYKRSGVAIIGMVLVMFLVFSILTVAAFNYAIQTLRIERWHVEYQEQVRLTYIARSAVNAIAEELMKFQADNGGAFNYFSTDPFNDKNTGLITVSGIEVNVIVSGDLDPNLYIEAEAENAEAKKSKVSALYSTDEQMIIDWSENE